MTELVESGYAICRGGLPNVGFEGLIVDEGSWSLTRGTDARKNLEESKRGVIYHVKRKLLEK